MREDGVPRGKERSDAAESPLSSTPLTTKAVPKDGLINVGWRKNGWARKFSQVENINAMQTQLNILPFR